MANAAYMFLSDCDYDYDSSKATTVNVHVVDLSARGFTKVMKANEFFDSLRTTKMHDDILAVCEDFDFVTVICSIRHSERFNLFETHTHSKTATLQELITLDKYLSTNLM